MERVGRAPACREEIHWWLRNPCRVNGQAIRPRPFPPRIDSHVFSDAGDTSAGSVISVQGPEAAASSVVPAVQRTAPPGMFHEELVERARRGIEFMMLLVREDSPP